MEIKLYSEDYKTEWDTFVSKSKNGTFLLYRDFIEYHGTRFIDYSFMFYSDGLLIALLPGHVTENIYYSHQGLTYGGLIMDEYTTGKNVLDIFEYLTVTLRHQGIKKIIYKAIPHIYHKLPAEEDLYALFRYNAIISARGISSTILLSEKIKYSSLRKRGKNKASRNVLTVEASDSFEKFWEILSTNLQVRYNKFPVHTLSEIVYLKGKFPNQIHLYVVRDQGENVLAGCVLFESPNVIHVQYNAATEEGKSKGAVDILIDYVINNFPDKKYFDYGISTEDNGWYLNENLIYQKEGFGARAVVYDTYTINL